MNRENEQKAVQSWAVTMIDPATGLLETAEIKIESADILANAVETAWFSQHPWPENVICD